jgi:GNAT superfamily N-acetyltransferase
MLTVADTAVRLQRVLVPELPEFARRAAQESDRYAIVPITVQRADAQAKNPAAAPDDVGLIVAYLEDQSVGYLGMFPVWLEDQGRRRKVLTLSTYFVGPEHRGTGAGALLLLHAMSLGHDLFVAGFSEMAGRVYRGVGFRPAGSVTLLTLRIDAALGLPLLLGRLRHRFARRGPGVISRAFEGVRRLSRKTVEAALRPIVIRLLMRPSGPTSANIAFCPVETVRDPQGFRHAERALDGSRFVRDDAVVNWMIHHPWITEDRSIRLNYAFSYRRDLFRFLPFQLQAAGSGQDLGYVVLHVSTEAERTVLKILDCVLVDERHRHDVLRLALREALRWSVDRIECGEEFGPLLDSTHLHRMLTRRETRECLAFTADRGGPHGDRSREMKLRICDGDAPFV